MRRLRVAVCLAVVGVLSAAQGAVASDWTVQSIPIPAGASGGELNGVSCTSAEACTAVGYSRTNVGASRIVFQTLAERWNGRTWSIQPTPKPAGSEGSVCTTLRRCGIRSLYGVSCASATACTAVGSFVNSAGIVQALAERWNGSDWAIQNTADVAGAFGGVSCTSATACTAVGTRFTSDGFERLAERWNGSNWVIQSVPGSADKNTGLTGVSCTSAKACVAVGTFLVVDVWNGTSWSAQRTVHLVAGAVFQGVSCVSPSACTAVGGLSTADQGFGVGLPLAETWDGTSWSIHNTPNPTINVTGLLGVSCTSPSACTAVGSYAYGQDSLATLVEVWNGTRWSIQSTPIPNTTDQIFNVFNGVSCPSSTACTAVGYTQLGYTSNGNLIDVPLVEQRRG
jgi:hypothetical protein